MLANLRRKVGLVAMSSATPMPPPQFAEGMLVPSPGPGTFVDPTVPAPFTMEELGFVWPNDRNDRSIFDPTTIPLWLQEQVLFLNLPLVALRHVTDLAGCQSLTDLGLPVNGSDGIFLQVTGSNGWAGELAPMPEAW